MFPNILREIRKLSQVQSLEKSLITLIPHKTIARIRDKFEVDGTVQNV